MKSKIYISTLICFSVLSISFAAQAETNTTKSFHFYNVKNISNEVTMNDCINALSDFKKVSLNTRGLEASEPTTKISSTLTLNKVNNVSKNMRPDGSYSGEWTAASILDTNKGRKLTTAHWVSAGQRGRQFKGSVSIGNYCSADFIGTYVEN